MRLAFESARRGLRDASRSPGWIAPLYALNIALTLTVGALLAWRVDLRFTHPPLDLLGWIVALRRNPGCGLDLAVTTAGALALYLLLASLVNGAVLVALASLRPKAQLGRVALRLGLLSVVLWALRLVVVIGWGLSGYGLHRWSSSWRLESWLTALHAVTALPFLSALCLVGLLGHHAQPLLVRGPKGPSRALGASLGLLRRQPTAATGLWTTYWLCLLAATAAALTLQSSGAPAVLISLGTQLAVVCKAGAKIWAWSCTLRLDSASN